MGWVELPAKLRAENAAKCNCVGQEEPQLFRFLFQSGYAGLIANNGLEYDEKLIAEHLERAWNGASFSPWSTTSPGAC